MTEHSTLSTRNHGIQPGLHLLLATTGVRAPAARHSGRRRLHRRRERREVALAAELVGRRRSVPRVQRRRGRHGLSRCVGFRATPTAPASVCFRRPLTVARRSESHSFLLPRSPQEVPQPLLAQATIGAGVGDAADWSTGSDGSYSRTEAVAANEAFFLLGCAWPIPFFLRPLIGGCTFPQNLSRKLGSSAWGWLCEYMAHDSLKTYVCVLYCSPCAPLMAPWLGQLEGTSMAIA